MALSVQTNNAAMTALKNLNQNSMAMDKSLERLSSGFRVNNAADDASGYAVSSKLDAQTQRLKAASLNATQAQAMTKMADAGVNEIQNMVVRIQTLATQASSANNAGELGKLDAERIKLESAIDKIAGGTNYNGVNLLNGVDAASAATTAAVGTLTFAAGTNTGVTGMNIVSNVNGVNDVYTIDMAADGLTATVKDAAGATQGSKLLTTATAGTAAANQITLTNGTVVGITIGTTDTVNTGAGTGGTGTVAGAAVTAAAGTGVYATALSFQVGADNNANNQVSVDLRNSYTTTSLGLGAGDLTTQANAQAYMDTAKAALNTLVTQRADLGATQNQVAFVQSNLATSIEQTTASVSSIRDADMAAEMAQFTKNQILTQASTSMLAQANQAAQNVMTLFR